ncbi:MAG TPA: hypothetical protein VMG34_09540 [Bacteroidota bacterium]|nr:hypothetical protein [Bacteroidota bacterium]
MMKKSTRDAAVILGVVLLLSPILVYPGWLPDDTYWMLSTLKYKSWQSIADWYMAVGDRFMPLSASLNRIMAGIAITPTLFFLGNYLTALMSVLTLIWIGRRLYPKVSLVPLLVILTPAFSSHFYVIFTQKELLLLWSAFLALVMVPMSENLRNPSNRIFLALIPANIALYYIENSLVLLSMFAFALLAINNYRSDHTALRETGRGTYVTKFNLFLVLLLASSFIFFIQYLYFTHFRDSHSYLTARTPEWGIIPRARYSLHALLMYVKNDPLILLAMPLGSFSAHRTLRRAGPSAAMKNRNVLLLSDSLAVCALVYVLSFVTLGLYEDRYLLPAYPFALVALMGYGHLWYEGRPGFAVPRGRRMIRWGAGLIVGVAVLNSMIYAINVAVYDKFNSYNFTRFNDALLGVVDSRLASGREPIRISYPGWNYETALYLERMNLNMLHFRGYALAENDSTFERNWTNPQSFRIAGDSISYLYDARVQNWTIPVQAGASDLRPGDLFLLLPMAREEGFEAVRKRCIFKTESPGYFELPVIQAMAKRLLRKLQTGAKSAPIGKQVDYAIYEAM